MTSVASSTANPNVTTTSTTSPTTSTASQAVPETTQVSTPVPPAQYGTGFETAKATPVALASTPAPASSSEAGTTGYPRKIDAGWDQNGQPIRAAGWGRISQDPANPFQELSGPVGARTGAKFIEVVSRAPQASPPNSLELTNKFVQGLVHPGSVNYSQDGARRNEPAAVKLSDFSGRVADIRKYGSEADVADALASSATPEEYAAKLDAMGGYVKYDPVHKGVSWRCGFGVTTAIDGTSPTGKVDLSPHFALGNYAQVATYLAANPDVQALAKEHPTLHPHVVAEWHFAQHGCAEGRAWPKEVTVLPEFHNVVGYAAPLSNDPYAKRVLQGYLDRNPDVAALAEKFGKSPLSFAKEHYDAAGRFEGRTMGPMTYGGRQGSPDFERYYQGMMTRAQEKEFWNPPQQKDFRDSPATESAGNSRTATPLSRTKAQESVTSHQFPRLLSALSPELFALLRALPPDLLSRLEALPPEFLEALRAILSAMGADQKLRVIVESFLANLDRGSRGRPG